MEKERGIALLLGPNLKHLMTRRQVHFGRLQDPPSEDIVSVGDDKCISRKHATITFDAKK